MRPVDPLPVDGDACRTCGRRPGDDRRSLYHHQDFQGRHYYAHFARPTDLREQFRDEPWFALCEQFTDDWDQVAFDPDGPVESLEHFEPLVREVFARPRTVV